MRRRVTVEKWFRYIEAWRTSGLTQAAWCRANRVNIKSFTNAKMRLAKEAIPTDEPAQESRPSVAQLIQLHITDDSSSQANAREQVGMSSALSSGIALRVDNYRIELALAFDGETLKRLLQVLAA